MRVSPLSTLRGYCSLMFINSSERSYSIAAVRNLFSHSLCPCKRREAEDVFVARQMVNLRQTAHNSFNCELRPHLRAHQKTSKLLTTTASQPGALQFLAAHGPTCAYYVDSGTFVSQKQSSRKQKRGFAVSHNRECWLKWKLN